MERERLTVSVDELSVMLGISRGLAYEMVRQGRIPALKLGKRLIISRRVVDDLLVSPNGVAASRDEAK